jgi:hypothetical protein
MKPNYIAPLISAASKRKNWKVSQVLCEDAWVTKIILDSSFTMEHFTQLVDLWTLISNILLVPGVDDDIVWGLTLNGNTRQCRMIYNS